MMVEGEAAAGQKVSEGEGREASERTGHAEQLSTTVHGDMGENRVTYCAF